MAVMSPAGLIRETIKHSTEPMVPEALGQEEERDIRGKREMESLCVCGKGRGLNETWKSVSCCRKLLIFIGGTLICRDSRTGRPGMRFPLCLVSTLPRAAMMENWTHAGSRHQLQTTFRAGGTHPTLGRAPHLF